MVKKMRQLFSEQGIPVLVRSDKGPHFSGLAFQEFARDLSFKHTTSSSHYPCSNGFIESQVKSVKSALLKSKMAKSDHSMLLLCLRATPIDHKLSSPTELILGCPIQDNPSSEGVISRLIERQQLQKHYYDQSAKPLPEQRITIQDPASLTWKPGEAKERLLELLTHML